MNSNLWISSTCLIQDVVWNDNIDILLKQLEDTRVPLRILTINLNGHNESVWLNATNTILQFKRGFDVYLYSDSEIYQLCSLYIKFKSNTDSMFDCQRDPYWKHRPVNVVATQIPPAVYINRKDYSIVGGVDIDSVKLMGEKFGFKSTIELELGKNPWEHRVI